MAGITRKRAARRRGLVGLIVAFTLVVGLSSFGTSASPARAQVGGETSFAVGLMKSAANGAAGQLGGDLVGWVLGSAGSSDQDLQVLNEILDELDTIENTLVGIENEIAELLNAIQQLDCDEWVRTALPMVNAISNLWDPNSVSAGGPGAPPPQQSYVGINAETRNNTVTLADLEVWSDQVLNNNNQGISGLSILDYMQDLGNVLIPPTGGSGIIQSCLGVSSNGPSQYKGKTDNAYYNDIVVPLVGYYYAIQSQGMVMVMEALNFEAWQAAGSPISTTQNIQQLPDLICGDSSGAVQQFCENASWVVLGENGTTGVRGRVAAQLTLGGAGYTWPGLLGESPVHRYVSSTNLWASDPELFTTRNSPNCNEMNSNAPCGILSGIYSNTTVGGTYGFYGAGEEGTWAAASGPQLTSVFQNAPNFNTNFANLGDYLNKERGFSPMPSNVIFVTNQVVKNYPYNPPYYVSNDVITFTDTGLIPGQFPPLLNPSYHLNYFNVTNALQVRVRQSGGCDYFATNPALPAGNKNKNFYTATSHFCPTGGVWDSGNPGWVQDAGNNTNWAAQHPQFRLPVIDITKLKCNSGLKATNPGGARAMCGDDFYAWLDAQVPPADGAPGWSEPPDNSWEMKLPDDPTGVNPGGDDLPYDRRDIRKGEQPSKKNVKPSDGDLDPLEIQPELDIGVPDALSGPFEDPGGDTFMNRDPGRPGKPGPPDNPGPPDSPGKPWWVEFQPGRR